MDIFSHLWGLLIRSDNSPIYLATLVLIASSLYFFIKSKIEIWAYQKKDDVRRRRSIDVDAEIKELKNSSFFNYLKFKLNVKLYVNKFSDDPGIDLLYKDLLRMLLTSFYTTFNERVDRLKFLQSDKEFETHWHSALNETLENFSLSCDKEGISDIAKVSFLAWVSPFITELYKFISDISRTEINIYNKTRLLLLSAEMVLVIAVGQLKVKEIFNGRLKGLEYKGMILGKDQRKADAYEDGQKKNRKFPLSG